MAYEVLKSRLRGIDNFDAIVRQHAKNLRDWHAHQELVAAKQADPYPPPSAPEIVDSAVRRPDFVPDYELIDDTIRMARDSLLGQISEAEAKLHAEIVPPGKRRLYADDPQHAPAFKRMAAVSEHATKLMAEVEDLPPDKLASWSFSFPKVA